MLVIVRYSSTDVLSFPFTGKKKHIIVTQDEYRCSYNGSRHNCRPAIVIGFRDPDGAENL